MTTTTEVSPEATPGSVPQARESVDVMIGQILHKDVEEVNSLLMEEGKFENLATEVAETLVRERNGYQEMFPWFDWDAEEDEKLKGKIEAYFLSQIDQHIMYLREKAGVLEHKTERLAEIEKDPEKRSLWRRAIDKVKGFAKRHPILTAVGIAALAFAAVGTGFWLAGEWELFATSTGLNKLFASTGAAKELIGNTSGTAPFTGSGPHGSTPLTGGKPL